MNMPTPINAMPQPVQPIAQASGSHKFLEFTISGAYYNAKKEIIDFDGVKGRIPYCDEEKGVGSMHVRGRFAEKWIKEEMNEDGEPKYPQRIHKMRQVFIDDVRPATGHLSFVGKDIKNLSIDEMQELAVAKDLRFIPVPNSGMSKRDMLIRTYVAYADKVLLKKIRWQDEDFNFAALPSIILDASFRAEKGQKITNEEMIDAEQKSRSTADPRKAFTLEELKTLADSKNIQYAPEADFDELYGKLFQV